MRLSASSSCCLLHPSLNSPSFFVSLSLATNSLHHRATRPWRLGDFDIGKGLGKGKFGRVYVAKTRQTPHFIVALKCMYKKEILENRLESQLRREIEIQMNLR